jgi:hypothetical protein
MRRRFAARSRFWIWPVLALLPAFAALPARAQEQEGFFTRLADSALSLTHVRVVYDPSYFSIAYPMGDVPSDRGVCTDVVIRAYRKVGIDLQREVHEDMRAHFDRYPAIWGLTRTDTNIDHRRVPNLMTFFGRKGRVMPITRRPADYHPGDIVCWQLGGGRTHIGIVVRRTSRDGLRHLVVHNIGRGQVAEDVLFRYPIIGHYRYQ